MRHLHNPDQPSDPLDTVHVSGATACKFCQDAPDLPADYRLNLSQGVAQRLRGAIANLLPRQAPYADFVQAICAQAADEASRLRLLRALDVPGLFSAFHEGRCAASCEYRQIDAAGKIAWALLAIHLAQDAKSGDILGRLSIRNIDERKKQELSLGEKVTRDPLTDLYDQAGTEAMIDNLIGSKAKAKTLSALFLIAVEVADGRLKLSDGKLLCDVASTLNACFVSEAIIGHMGHGQFVVFLADAHTDTQALSFAQAATQKLLSLPHREKNRPTLSASTGIALAQAPLASYPVLLSHARQAMRNAAKQGCNRCMRYDAESGCAQDAAYAQQNHSLLIDALDYAVMVLDLPDVKLRYVNRYVSRHATAEQQRLLIAYSQHLARRNLDFLQSAPDESAFEAYQATECLFRFKPILWNGRRACLMLAVERTHPLLSTGADLHDPLLKLLDQLNRASDDRSAIQAVLSCLGELYAPDHAYFLGCATSAQLGDTRCVWDDPTAPVHEAASEDARAAIEDWLRGSTLPGMMLNDASGQSEAPGLTCAMDALGVRALYYAQDASHQARATRLIYLTNPKRHLGSLSLLLGAMPLLCARLTQFEQANQLEFLAGHDALTGLGNRLCYTRTLDQLNPESLSSLGIVSVD
ncbi:MAG: diguanylate cyclase, partial [Clostridia bacterium]